MGVLSKINRRLRDPVRCLEDWNQRRSVRRQKRQPVDLSSVPEKYRPLVKKIATQFPISKSQQTIRFPDGFVLKGGRVENRFDLFDLPADLSDHAVLDIGCSTGAVAIECKKRGASRVLGLDKNPDIIECALEIARHLDLAIAYEAFDLAKDEINEDFDYVFMLNVFQHVDEKTAIRSLRTVDRITRKAFYFEAPVEGDRFEGGFSPRIRRRYFSEQDYHCYLRGFTRFSEIETLGTTDFGRPLIRCRR